MKKDKSDRDEFTLSLGGMRTITAFTAAPAIAHDQLRQGPPSQARDTPERKRRFWTPRRFRVA